MQALIQSDGETSGTSVQLSSDMSFKFNDLPVPSKLYVDVAYRSPGSWLLPGQADDISLGSMSEFFAPSVRASANKMLGGLNLRRLETIYTYDASGEAMLFFIFAALILGELELDLSYAYASTRLPRSDPPAAQIAKTEVLNSSDKAELRPQATEASWAFEAVLGAASPAADIGKIVDSLVPGASVLPPFVRRIPVGAAASGGASVKLVLREISSSTILGIAITISDISLTFISLVSANSGPSQTVLRVNVDEITVVKNLPVIKELPQPFHSMLYLWLDDETSDRTKAGLSVQELQSMNDALADLTRDTNKQNEALPALRAGHHFMIVNKSTVILDHNFSNTDATSMSSGTSDPSDLSASAADVDSGPTKGALDKRLPLLSITALALIYKRGALGISIDATVRLGPFTFSLIGFSVGIVLLTLKLDDLSSVESAVDIYGLEVLLDFPPVTLAGAFIHDTGVPATGEALQSYRDGVALGFESRKFPAVGEYAVLSNPDGRGE